MATTVGKPRRMNTGRKRGLNATSYAPKAEYEKKYTTAGEARKKGLSSTSRAAEKAASKIRTAQAKAYAKRKDKLVSLKKKDEK